MRMRISVIARSMVGLALALTTYVEGAEPHITVFKTRTCGCCSKWVEHLRAHGFTVNVKEVDSTAPYQRQYAVPQKLQSCHTAVVEGYVIEGHVPATDIQRLLKTRPNGKGLAVPGMPIGSPGMEGARSEPYSVLLFDANGGATAFQRH
jgi:hypothetical protein